jgi:hypothetical protein
MINIWLILFNRLTTINICNILIAVDVIVKDFFAVVISMDYYLVSDLQNIGFICRGNHQ